LPLVLHLVCSFICGRLKVTDGLDGSPHFFMWHAAHLDLQDSTYRSTIFRKNSFWVCPYLPLPLQSPEVFYLTHGLEKVVLI